MKPLNKPAIALGIISAAVAAAVFLSSPLQGEVKRILPPDSSGNAKAELAVYKGLLQSLTIGTPRQHGALTIFPLQGKGQAPFYDTMDDALENKTLIAQDTGVVEDVKLTNKGPKPVLIVDGEEILGAKQNRIFNSSLLIPPGKTIIAKVSCVEQGRWSNTTTAFKPAKTQLFARARQAKSEAVSYNMFSAGVARSDQGEVWRQVSEVNAAVAAPSESSAMHKAYEVKKDQIDDYVKALRAVPQQMGAIFAIGAEIVGLDVFDSPATYSKMSEKLIKSYALDAISREKKSKADTEAISHSARQFFNLAKEATGKAYDSQGEGRDLRLSGYKISGGALIARNLCLHAAVFAKDKTEKPTPKGRIAPPNVRQRSQNIIIN